MQFGVLTIHLGDGSLTSIITYQNDTNWGLCIRKEAVESSLEQDGGIFRDRWISELPTGVIENVEINLDEDGDIRSISLLIDNRTVNCQAGEVYEEYDGSLKIVYGDESILVKVI